MKFSMLTGIMLNIIALQSAGANPLDAYTYANTTAINYSRYATPGGNFLGSLPTNYIDAGTGVGIALLNPSLYDSNSGSSADTSFGTMLAGPSAAAVAVMGYQQTGGAVTSAGDVFYAFEVSGGSIPSGAFALVDVTAMGATHVDIDSAIGSAQASLTIEDVTTGITLFSQNSNLSCDGHSCAVASGFTDAALPLSVPIGDIIRVFLTTEANSQLNQGTFSATVDPVITLDKGDPSGLQITFGSAISQSVSSVPEPSSALLLALGVLCLVARTTKRR
jgi:hypothetical protein